MRWVAVLALMVGCAGAQKRELNPDLIAAQRTLDKRVAASLYRKAFASFEANGTRPDVQHYVAFANLLFEIAEYDECLSFTENSAVGDYTYSAGLHDARAMCLLALGRQDEALEAANLAARVDETRYRSQLIRGHRYARDDARRCAEAYSAYLRYRPSNLRDADALPRYVLGVCRLRLRDGPPAEFSFEVLRRQFPKKKVWVSRAHSGLCAADVLMGRYRRAVARCKRVVADPYICGCDASVWYNLAQARYRLGHYTRALTAVDHFIARAPNKPKGPALRENILDAMSRQWSARK